MSLKPDHKYSGIVRPGSCLIESQTGTLGYQVMLDCEDGETYFIIWMTEKNRQKAIRAFEALEVPMTKLNQPLFLEADLGRIIEGKEISFGTRENTYKGRTSIQVAWIGKKSEGTLSKDAAKFFNKSPSQQGMSTQENLNYVGDNPLPPEDDSVPF